MFLPRPPYSPSTATPTNGVLGSGAVSFTGSMCLAWEEGAFKWAADFFVVTVPCSGAVPAIWTGGSSTWRELSSRGSSRSKG